MLLLVISIYVKVNLICLILSWWFDTDDVLGVENHRWLGWLRRMVLLVYDTEDCLGSLLVWDWLEVCLALMVVFTRFLASCWKDNLWQNWCHYFFRWQLLLCFKHSRHFSRYMFSMMLMLIPFTIFLLIFKILNNFIALLVFSIFKICLLGRSIPW